MTDHNRLNSWLRLLASLGLLFTDSKFRDDAGKKVKGQVEQVINAVSDRYEDAVDRLEAATDALRGRRQWPSKFVALLAGVGIGTGIGLILAPAAGSETRKAIRDQTVNLKNRATERASNIAARVRPSASSIPATGTEG